jgi:hypothetical protein
MKTNFNLNFSRTFLYIVLFISSFTSFAQVKEIVLQNKNNQKKIFIQDNKRVKIRIASGEKIIGYCTILDEKTLKVNDIIIPLDSIVTIQERSLFNSIARPILFVTGTLALGLGIAGAVAGGYGYLATLVLVPPGLPMVLVPVLSNKHSNKNWNYQIENIE